MTEKRSQFTTRTIRQRRRFGVDKLRQLEIPFPEDMTYQRSILHLLHGLHIDMPHATGSLPGKRLIDNVEPHRQNNFFYMVDLKNAFPSVDADVLQHRMRTEMPRRHRALLRDFVSNHATSKLSPGLPLGAPASPWLFNYYCLPMDSNIGKLCGDAGITYTRYLDDLTFSSPDVIGQKRRRHLRDLIQQHPGMVVNHAKSRVHSLYYGPVTITGLSLYPDRRIGPSPSVLEAASQTYERVAQLAVAGAAADHDIAQLQGYHGALLAMYDGETPTSRWLAQIYNVTLGRLGLCNNGA